MQQESQEEREARGPRVNRSGWRPDLAVGQNQWYHFGVGAPHILVYFSGDWDVHWGYGMAIWHHFGGGLFSFAVRLLGEWRGVSSQELPYDTLTGEQLRESEVEGKEPHAN